MRYVRLPCSRIGHFALNTEIYLCERDAGLHRLSRHTDERFFHGPGRMSNRHLATMWERLLPFQNPPSDADVFDVWTQVDIQGGGHLLSETKPHLVFSDKDEIRGRETLESWGVDGPWVCLHVRDSAYLDAAIPNWDWRYHDHRDADVDTYVPACEYLVDFGFNVIRMGARVHKPIASDLVIDYATNGTRSEFMDIYLAGKCEFMITTGSGIDGVSMIFRRPCVFTNAIPAGYQQPHHPKNRFLNKHLRLHGEMLPEVENTRLRGDEYGDIEIIDNTPEELLACVRAMVA